MQVSAKDQSLEAAAPQFHPGEPYLAGQRKWQGIAGVEITPCGRLWATFYSGGVGEGAHNYVLLMHSDDDGSSWSDPDVVIDPPGLVRAYDPCLWTDPQGRLWWFWAQSYTWFDGRCGVWAMICSDPDAAQPTWTEPRRLFDGIMMNKPTVLQNGDWLFPVAIWTSEQVSHSMLLLRERYPDDPTFLVEDGELHQLPEERYSNVYCSRDSGTNFMLRGRADIPERTFDEHMIVEKQDGSLWMLVRTKYGVGQSVSTDQGRTWTPGAPTNLGGVDSRFFIRRLKSGNLFLINHDCPGQRSRTNLTAWLSEDDGKTWKWKWLLDDRDKVSYPDAVQSEDGTIYVIYDRERYGAKEILMAVFTEADIRHGRCVSEQARLQVLVNKA